jgi:hypothetical protein
MGVVEPRAAEDGPRERPPTSLLPARDGKPIDVVPTGAAAFGFYAP